MGTNDNKHECWIGYLNTYNKKWSNSDLQIKAVSIYTDDYIWKIKERIKSAGLYSKARDITVYLDGKSDLVIMFQYCPICGERIDWKQLTEALTNG